MYNHESLSDDRLARLLPHTMGTQHPDNVSKVPFGDSPRVDRHLEEEEVLYNVMVLGLPELMIDYEKKQGGCTPLWDWLHKCPTCLEERVIGRDFHVTPRIPNGDGDRDDPYFWQSMGIFVNSLLVMKRMGLDWLAFTEFIVPDTNRGATVAQMERDILDLYRLQSSQYSRYGERTPFPYEGNFFVQGIPLIETVENLLNPEPIWDALIARRKELTGVETHVQRSFIARSDPALKAGIIPALLAASVALHRGRQYETRTGVRIPQIVGIGSAPFRGGITPEPAIIAAILATYPGMATVTVQSAFRYDHPEEEVIQAARILDGEMARAWSDRHGHGEGPSLVEVGEIRQVVEVFKEKYEDSYRELLPLVSQVAQRVPSHRDRYTDVEITGEVRRVGGMPAVRAIKFAASCYTLGLPPGLFGMRAWTALTEGQRALVEKTCPMARFWLAQELQWFNGDNLRRLQRLHGLRRVAEDAEAATTWAQDYRVHSPHAEITGRLPRCLEEGADFTPVMMEAALERRFLG